MTFFELFRRLLTHLFSFFNFSPREVYIGKLVLSVSDSRVRYFKGQTWLTLKAATAIIDHGVTTRISVEQRAKVLFFKEKQRVFTPGNRAEMSNLEVNCSINM